jgi:hypothetical protein
VIENDPRGYEVYFTTSNSKKKDKKNKSKKSLKKKSKTD